MKFSVTALALLAATGTSALPSGHGHEHAHRALEERANNVVVVTKYETVVQVVNPTGAPQPQPPQPAQKQSQPQPQNPKQPEPSKAEPAVASLASVAKPSASGDSTKSSGGSGSKTFKPFCGGKSKRATMANIMYKGNVGVPGNYGCNLMLVDNSIASQYPYKITVSNRTPKKQSCKKWLKVGPDGGINGFFQGNEVGSFDIPAGGQQVIAVDKDSQGGLTCDFGGVPTRDGIFVSTWIEFDLASSVNKGWSGADASELVPSDKGVKSTGAKVCFQGKCSYINRGGGGANAYFAGTHAEDGIGLNIPPGNVNLEVEFS